MFPWQLLDGADRGAQIITIYQYYFPFISIPTRLDDTL